MPPVIPGAKLTLSTELVHTESPLTKKREYHILSIANITFTDKNKKDIPKGLDIFKNFILKHGEPQIKVELKFIDLQGIKSFSRVLFLTFKN